MWAYHFKNFQMHLSNIMSEIAKMRFWCLPPCLPACDKCIGFNYLLRS